MKINITVYVYMYLTYLRIQINKNCLHSIGRYKIDKQKTMRLILFTFTYVFYIKFLSLLKKFFIGHINIDVLINTM